MCRSITIHENFARHAQLRMRKWISAKSRVGSLPICKLEKIAEAEEGHIFFSLKSDTPTFVGSIVIESSLEIKCFFMYVLDDHNLAELHDSNENFVFVQKIFDSWNTDGIIVRALSYSYIGSI